MQTDYEYIVIGLGGLGSAALYWLSRRAGKDVLGIEQFELGHVYGESQDHSRIIRLSYHTPEYVKLAQRAYRCWAEVETESKEVIIVKTGGLDLWPPNSAISMQDYSGSLQTCGVSFEALDAGQIRRRFPQFHITDDTTGMFQQDGGIAAAAIGMGAHRRLARDNGAVWQQKCPVSRIEFRGNEYVVQALGHNYRCRRLILTAGPWSNHMLAHLGMKLPLTITQEQVTYFSAPDPDYFLPERFPIWIWMDDPCYYGFPVFGENAVKVGQDVGGKEVTPETRTFDADQEALARVQVFLQRHIPASCGPVLYTKSCLYTLTPDRDFVIDELSPFPGCFVVIGAGHAYKFASVIGRILSELAVDGSTRSDIRAFSIDRAILKMENPPKHFMT